MLIQDEINTAMSCRIQIRTPVSAVTRKDVSLKNSWHGFPTSERRQRNDLTDILAILFHRDGMCHIIIERAFKRD